MAEYLYSFARIARNSREYQGDGWGCAYLAKGQWQSYRTVQAIWGDDLDQFPPTTLLLAHVRSASACEGLGVEKNMPFQKGGRIFMFNGYLRGVRIKQAGASGAEKLFNLITSFDRGDLTAALRKTSALVHKRSKYVRAMNVIIAEDTAIHLSSRFNEDPDYFTMWRLAREDRLVLCSEVCSDDPGWESVPNGTTSVFPVFHSPEA